MKGLSERAYAERSGLTRGAVQKTRKNGRLVLFADGSIDAVASDARRGAMTDPDQQLRSRGSVGGVGAGGEGGANGSSNVSGPGDTTPYLKARTAQRVCGTMFSIDLGHQDVRPKTAALCSPANGSEAASRERENTSLSEQGSRTANENP